MKRVLLSIRLSLIALLLVMGIVAGGTAAHAAPQATNGPAAPLATAARSVWVIIRNNSKYQLTAPQYYLTSGVWTVRPNPVIQPGQESGFGSESNGFMTGTHGSVTYSVSNNQQLSFTWTNPYVGSNSYSTSLSGYPSLGKIYVTRSGGSGNNAVVTITISNA